MSDFNSQIISEFRANHGHVTAMGFGDVLVLLHTVGAKSGLERINPVRAFPSGEDWIIVASKGGAPENPDWYANLRKNPDATIETGTEEVEVTATELTGPERDDAWRRIVSEAPGFGEYQERAVNRVIPVLRLSRRPTS